MDDKEFVKSIYPGAYPAAYRSMSRWRLRTGTPFTNDWIGNSTNDRDRVWKMAADAIRKNVMDRLCE